MIVFSFSAIAESSADFVTLYLTPKNQSVIWTSATTVHLKSFDALRLNRAEKEIDLNGIC